MRSHRKSVIHRLTAPALASERNAQVRRHMSQSSTLLCPQACLLFHPTWRQLIQGPESLRDLQQRGQIWQPKFRTDVRVLTSQFLAIKTVSWTLIQRSTLSFKKNKSYLGLFGLFSLFRLYLAERWVNSTELSSFLIFFMFS